MSATSELKIGEKALLVSFMRVRIGKEFDVANTLSKRFGSSSDKPLYYTAYGAYDLFELQMVDSYETVHNVPFHPEILGYESSIFYSWQDVSADVYTWAKGFPVLLSILLRINQNVQDTNSFELEKHLIGKSREFFGEHANSFAGTGQNEILLLLRGEGFESLLRRASSFRRDLTSTSVNTSEPKVRNEAPPILFSSTTFPLIAHPALKGSADYSELQGKVLPYASIACDPGCEQVVINNRPQSCNAIYEICGFQDVVLTWKKPLELNAFAKELTNFREKIGDIEGIKNTETILLETPARSGEEDSHRPVIEHKKYELSLIPGTDVILKKSSLLDHTTKARLLEFWGYLHSCYIQTERRSSVQDILGIRFSIEEYLRRLEEARDNTEKFIIQTGLSEIVDLGNNGLYQRYTELEPRSSTCRRLPFPFLRGINRYILAASCIPQFIYRSVFPGELVDGVWPGFVLFGLSYSYQLLRGRVLSIPANALQRPIEDWWGITHEVAHSISWAKDFYKKELPSDLKEKFEEIQIPTSSFTSLDPEEIYAHWFDFTYIFQGNIERYFPTIWRSWLRWERTRELKVDYLLRSLIIYMTKELDSLYSAQLQSFDRTVELLASKYAEMKDKITARVPEFREFASAVTGDEIRDMAYVVQQVEPYLNFLENHYFDREMYDKLNPTYAKLDKHVALLQDGVVITEEIANPIKLLHTLNDSPNSEHDSVPLKTTAATVLTLWHKYLVDRGK